MLFRHSSHHFLFDGEVSAPGCFLALQIPYNDSNGVQADEEVRNNGEQGSPFATAAADVTQGAVMEATFILPATSDPNTWPGFIVQKPGSTTGTGAYFIGMSNQGWATVGNYNYNAATGTGAIQPGERWGRDLPLTAGQKVKARLLYSKIQMITLPLSKRCQNSFRCWVQNMSPIQTKEVYKPPFHL